MTWLAINNMYLILSIKYDNLNTKKSDKNDTDIKKKSLYSLMIEFYDQIYI